METYGYVLIGVVGSVFIVAIIVVIWLYKRHSKLLNKVQSMQTTSPAFSMGGNFVIEHGRNKPISDFYVISSVLLGRGSSAEVVVGTSKKTHHRYAIKVIDLSKHGILWRYEKEKSILKDVDHTNIVRLFEVFNSMKAQFFVMELCTGGHLGQVLRDRPDSKLDEETARTYMLQICRAISHCHQRGICHRDIKLQNILLESNSPEAQIKLVDFGNSARFVGMTPFTKIVGTTYTAAPEVFRESYDEKCDIWSTGVVAYILLSGKRPFESSADSVQDREKGVIMSILMGKYNFLDDSWDDVSPIAVHFVQCCMDVDYKKRRSSMEILDHPFLVYADIFSLDTQQSTSLSVIERLWKNVACYTGLRRVSMLAIAFTLPSRKLQALRLVYQSIDVLGTGNITRSMFSAELQNSKTELDTVSVYQLFDIIDQDCDNSISFIEFAAAAIDPVTITSKELRAAFTLLDHGEKGYLLPDDLKRVLLTSNAASPFHDPGQRRHSMQDKTDFILKYIDEVFVSADLDKDGKITYTEFLFAVADKAPIKAGLRSNSVKTTTSTRNTMAITGEPSGGAPQYIMSSLDRLDLSEKKKFRDRRQSDSVLRLSGKYQRRSSAMGSKQSSKSIEKPRRGSVISDLYNIIVMPRDEIARRSKLLSTVAHVDDSPIDEDDVDVVAPLSKVVGATISRRRRNTSPDTLLGGLRRQSLSILKAIVALPIQVSGFGSLGKIEDSSDSNSNSIEQSPESLSVQDMAADLGAVSSPAMDTDNGEYNHDDDDDDDDIESGLGSQDNRSRFSSFDVSEINRENVRAVRPTGATEADASILADRVISSMTADSTFSDKVAQNFLGKFKSDDGFSMHSNSRDGRSNNNSFGGSSNNLELEPARRAKSLQSDRVDSPQNKSRPVSP